MRQAAELAAAEINAKGGVKGRPLRLRVADDSGREDTAVRVAEELYRDPDVLAVVGHLTSGTTIAAARVYGGGASPVPVISPSASSPDLSGINPYFFRVCPSDLSHGPELARFARQSLGAKRAGIVYINNDYGRGIRKTFAGEFTRLGGVVVEADPYVPATQSLEPYLSRMRRGGTDVLVLATERPGAELALREMRTLGLRWPVIGGDALTHPIISFRHPEWRPQADHVPEQAITTRKRLLDRLATDKTKFLGFHLPYPGVGLVERGDGAYRFVAV